MRKVVASLFISLDGVVESPDQWSFDSFDEAMMTEMLAQLDGIGSTLLGRVTYQEWASYWPTSTDEPFATYINNTPKYVVSTTLADVDWHNTTLLQGDLSQEINRLKQQPGKAIGTGGSPTLVQSLLAAGLVDELVLCVYPVIVGRGKRLFTDGSELKRLNLVSSKTTPSGIVILTYQIR